MDKYAKSVIDFSEIGFECGCMFNPIGNFSIVPFNGMYLASFRKFAYFITTDIQQYMFTQNMRLKEPHKQLFCLLDKDFKFVKQLPCVNSSYWEDPNFINRLPYLEDMRMVEWNGNLYGTSTIFYQGEKGYARIGMEFQQIVVGHDMVSCEHRWNSIPVGIKGVHKNFMPIPDKPFHFIAATFPKGVVMFDLQHNKFTTGGIAEPEKLIRGNTPLLKTDFGYMTIAHDLVFDDRKRKMYRNFVVEYNADLSVCRISRPFKFTDMNIEFITTFLEDGNDILIGNTIMDETPLLFRFNRDEFLSEVNKTQEVDEHEITI